ncbi:MAG TPA: glucosamine-6-phosphate deaminase [Candidatus Limiplasma sp.]|nr:glucosamine-6-phosphate deaminase [Candidatus Limiplasma sp.]
MILQEFQTYEQMCRKAANLISAQIILKADSVLGLATGSTPLGIYRLLVGWYQKSDLDFSQVRTVNLDEYCGVPFDSPHSYHYFMNENLFSKVNIPMENTHLPNGMAEDMPAECSRYDELISGLGGIDLQLLGIGHNGHIGFNEPADEFSKHTSLIQLSDDTIKANSRFFKDAAEVPRSAITMGMRSIMYSRKILLVANGKDKEDILHAAMNGPITPKIPASILQLHPDTTVLFSKE